jgi:hypothetical protein
MPNEVHTPPEPGLTSLVGGIINDFGDLIRQEIRFARAEIKSDLVKTREAVTLLGIGIGIASVAGLLLVWMLVHLLHWLTLPSGTTPDAATLPLWACFGIVGAALAVLGGILIQTAVRKFQTFSPLPVQTAETVKENVQWIANSK